MAGKLYVRADGLVRTSSSWPARTDKWKTTQVFPWGWGREVLAQVTDNKMRDEKTSLFVPKKQIGDYHTESGFTFSIRNIIEMIIRKTQTTRNMNAL